MFKFSALALVACLAMSVVSTGADAAVAFRGPPPPSNPGQGQNGPTNCVVDCFQIVQAQPTDCGVHKVVTLAPAELVLGGGKKPNPCASASGDVRACGDKLANLRRVTVAQGRRVDDNDSVHLVPICDIVHRSLTQVEMTYLARGNVQGLILPISQNDTLMAALDDQGYDANDVLGIVRGPGIVTLYVSRAPR
jgi:hypothetical protein